MHISDEWPIVKSPSSKKFLHGAIRPQVAILEPKDPYNYISDHTTSVLCPASQMMLATSEESSWKRPQPIIK